MSGEQDHAAGIVPRPERVDRLADFLAGSPDPTGWVVRRLRVAVEYDHSSQDIHLLVVELLAALDRVERIEQVAAIVGPADAGRPELDYYGRLLRQSQAWREMLNDGESR